MTVTTAGNFAKPLPPPKKTITVLPGMSIDKLWPTKVDDTLFDFPQGGVFPTQGLKLDRKNITLKSSGPTRARLVGQNCPAEYSNLLTVPQGMSGLHVEFMELDDNDDTKFSAVGVDGQNVTVMRCLFTERLWRGVFVGGNAQGVTVYKNEAPRGINTYLIYVASGAKFVTGDWNVGKVTSVNEHWIRSHGDDCRFIGNDLTMDRPNPDGSVKACINIREGTRVLVYKNVCRGDQTLIAGPLAAETKAYLRDVLITENQFLDSKQNQFFEGFEDFVFTNNTISMKDPNRTCIDIMPSLVSRPGPQGIVGGNRYHGGALFKTGADVARITMGVPNVKF